MDEKFLKTKFPEEKENRYVPWYIFVWAIGLISVVLGWIIWSNVSFANQLSDHDSKDVEIKTQLSQIQTDLSWIKTTLSNFNNEK